MVVPGEVVAENRHMGVDLSNPGLHHLVNERPSPNTSARSSPHSSGRGSPNNGGRNSPLRTSSPLLERKGDRVFIAANGAMEGINRAQLTLQELQDLAERQRQQILYNSKELMEKQQQLMRMHHDFRNRVKTKQDDKTDGKTLRTSDSSLPRSPKPASREQDQYARMLRQTYQSMGKLQNRNIIQNDIDIKKFSNVELAHELDKIRSIFKSKQNELADAVKKVDHLTHELEQRKSGDASWGTLPTPERINRRKKIQAAKDELDRLRNELIVRNEMNSQQSHQLQLQRDIIQEKQQELRQLNSRMHELGKALRKQKQNNPNGVKEYSNRKLPNYALTNGAEEPGLFTRNYLHDTLSRKRGSSKYMSHDINGNSITPPANSNVPPTNKGVINSRNSSSTSGFESDDSRDSRLTNDKNVYGNSPLSAKQLWNQSPKPLTIQTDNSNKSSPLYSPASSVSSLSSISSANAEEGHRINQINRKEPPPPVPTRTTPVGVLIERTEPSKPQNNKNNDFLAALAKEQEKIGRLQNDLQDVDKEKLALKAYSDAKLSGGNDMLQDKYIQYSDANLMKNDKPSLKPKPAVPAKPVGQVKPLSSDENENAENPDEGIDHVDRVVPPIEGTRFEGDDDVVIVPSASALYNGMKNSGDNNWSSNENHDGQNERPSEPEDFELSFADIDEINETQGDMWSQGSGSTYSQSSYDSESDDFDINVVPVVISVSPDKMPPPILMKPDKPRKPKRKLILDPFALLLDSALEGEMDLVKESLLKVPDPSRPNPEGITALHNAVCGNHKDVVKFLVEVGCDINSADNNGWTPLHCAAFYNDTELCRFLVENGASVFATTYTDHQTPAHKCSQLDDNYDECFAYLHECKENVGRIDNGIVHALYDYQNENDDELSFRNGDMLTILRRGDNLEKEWWWARDRSGQTGYIPCNLIGNFPRIAAEV